MASVVHVKGIPALQRAIQRDLRRLGQKARTAALKTAKAGARIVAKNAPEAFGHVKAGVEAAATSYGATTRSTAPYSAAVEVGSRAHMPPLAPILAWVKQKGMMGLGPKGGTRRGEKGGIQRWMRKLNKRGRTNLDTAMTIARAVQMAIAKRGTKPTWFVRRSLPELRAILAQHMHTAIKGKSE